MGARVRSALGVLAALSISAGVVGLAVEASPAHAQDCEVAAGAYDKLTNADPAVGARLDETNRGYEGAERDTPEFQRALYDVAVSAGYGYSCKAGEFRPAAEVEAEKAEQASADPGAAPGEPGATATTVPGTETVDLAGAGRPREDDDTTLQWALTIALCGTAVFSALSFARSR